MQRHSLRRLAFLPVAMAGVLAIAGCSKSVSSDDLEDQVSSSLQKKVGQKPKSVSCPDNLKAKVDETTHCTLKTKDGKEYGVKVKATDVDGSDVKFSMKVYDQPK